MKLANWLNYLVRIIVIISPCTLFAQELSLEQAQQRARENYPAIQLKALIKQTADLSIQNLNKGFYPQLALNGQATYQSDVTRINISLPGIIVNPMSKDQYKATADVNQVLFDGGLISKQKQLQRLNADVETERNEVELYKLRERINQIYLGILLLDEQVKQVELLESDIETGIRKTSALVENGLAFRSNLNSLEAEKLKTEQRNIELKSSRKGLVQTLSLYLGTPLDENVQFRPPSPVIIEAEIKRPELTLYQKQTDLINQQKQMVWSRNLPKASLFGQGGYGRPGLNMLQNEFDWFYMGGVRLNWNISNLYTARKERQLTELNAKSVSIQKETFLLNTASQLSQQKSEIEKLEALVETDKQIIALRRKIKVAANAQLENQVISASDYIREVNAEDQARQALIIHQLQLIQAQLNYNTIAGN
ncbi:TolC family protein [Pedobacter sp. P351]|uniref:TolC family protein n=1 Tax=Pedobacter superstes TaxID=3133441 RepID=UPI0030A20931